MTARLFHDTQKTGIDHRSRAAAMSQHCDAGSLFHEIVSNAIVPPMRVNTAYRVYYVRMLSPNKNNSA